MSPNKTSMSLLQKDLSPFQTSIVEVNKSSNNFGMIVNVNQAANYNHFNQRLVDYIFVISLAIFFVFVINFRSFKSTALPPPWYLVLKHKSRKSLSGWKVSTLLYKSKLLYQY